jgi:hypothetical protein
VPFGIGAKISTLGLGVEAGVGVASHTNIRAGFNFFDYSHSFDKDGVTYDGKLQLRSFEVRLDQYIAGPFHITPGVMLYNGNKATATIQVPGSRSFTLGDIQYFSSSTNPITGTGTVPMTKVAPELLFGFGNLLPRSGRHFGVNFEFGFAYQGPCTVR